MSAVRAALFDLDGVLVDSYEAWFLVVNEAARGFGFPAVSRERFHSIWGQGIDADVRNLYPGRAHDEVRAAYEVALPRHAAAIRKNPEGLEALARLRAGGIGTACVTNTPVALARLLLEGAGLARSFDVVSGARPGVREKPAPDLLLEALGGLGAPPSASVMVGDSRYDEAAAAAAGVPFVRYELRAGTSLLATVGPFLPPARAPRP